MAVGGNTKLIGFNQSGYEHIAAAPAGPPPADEPEGDWQQVFLTDECSVSSEVAGTTCCMK